MCKVVGFDGSVVCEKGVVLWNYIAIAFIKFCVYLCEIAHRAVDIILIDLIRSPFCSARALRCIMFACCMFFKFIHVISHYSVIIYYKKLRTYRAALGDAYIVMYVRP